MKKNLSALMIAFLLIAGFVSCKKEKIDPNEGELITTLRLKFTNQLAGSAVPLVYEFKDLDGDGGAAPVKFDSIILGKNIPYICEISVLNESVSPADDITKEIVAEADDHQFYFTPSPGALVTVSQLNTDSKQLPLGTTSFWSTAFNAGRGTINVTLKHKPGTKAANDPISKGDTDISIDFKLIIQ